MRGVFLCLVALSMAAPAFADDSVMASRFGNTTLVTNSNGRVSKVYYNADHTFTTEDPKLGIHGTWKVEGSTLCVTFTAHPPKDIPNPECDPVAPHQVGDSWKVGDATVSIAKGIVP